MIDRIPVTDIANGVSLKSTETVDKSAPVRTPPSVNPTHAHEPSRSSPFEPSHDAFHR